MATDCSRRPGTMDGYFLEFHYLTPKTPQRDNGPHDMKTLHLYLTRQVFAALLMTVVVFTFVLMLGNVLKEVLGLLVNRQADLLMVLQAVGLLIPYVMVFALPMGMLTATLLVFGRFSADNELTAVRASGVSLISLVTPVLLLSMALSGLAAAINLELAPRCRLAYKGLLYKVGFSKTLSAIPERTYIKDLDTNCIVYVSKVEGSRLEDVQIYQLHDNKVESYNRADDGLVQFNPTNNIITVVLTNTYSVTLGEGQQIPQPIPLGTVEFAFTNAPTRAGRRKIDLSDMTFQELRAELRYLERRLDAVEPMNNKSVDELRGRMKHMNSRRFDMTLPVRVQLHRQVSFSFACVAFTLLGIPLGIRAHRRETTFGIAVALVLVVIYYSFFILGQSLETRPDLAPHLILWLPNFVFQAVGIVLLWRANRGV